MTATFDYLAARDGLALQTGGPSQDGYRADANLHPDHVWQPRFSTERAPQGHSNPWNGEYQFYADPEFRWQPAYSPFAIVDDAMRIRAQRTQSAPALAAQLPTNSTTGRPYGWVSGVLNSRQAFSQQGGYFEIEAKMPKGRATWPAFWLLPVSERHPPELDVIEYLGDQPETYRATCISLGPNSFGPVYHAATVQAGADLSAAFHRYGMMWTDTAITYMLDDITVATVPIAGRAEFFQPFYMLVNLAIGSNKLNWVAAPDATTPDPADLLVRRIRAWQLRGPREIRLSVRGVAETATRGTKVADLTCVSDEEAAQVRYRLCQPSDLVTIDGAVLRALRVPQFLTSQHEDIRIEVTDSHNRVWQQPFRLAILDRGNAPNALAAGSQGSLAHPAWQRFGTRVEAAGGVEELLLETANADVHAIEQQIAKIARAERVIVSVDFKPHGRNLVKIEVSNDYVKNVQAIFDVAACIVTAQNTSLEAGGFRLNDCQAIRLESGFCRCLIDLTTDDGDTLRVSIKIGSFDSGRPLSDAACGVRSGAFFRVVMLGPV